ncbi:hypothetical protein FHS43_005888 [Streptosporangium becharense]|uniref:Uncharacterized protein n=1 Tax=Streptosporangium becharense TaxID=1816182 RepID=A0A7W9MK66_9ACTN|nr:hypothetical protein [Streptosporangium becharense]MBB2914576.1 hypothetical protein [Streptosporangium becharense]MBB5823421.1 hypothetical protein [Streptosporangium becharense]
MSRWINWAARVTATAAIFALPQAVALGTTSVVSPITYVAADSTWT